MNYNNINKRKNKIMNVLIENLIKQNDLFFISEKDNIETLKPRIPDNFMTKNDYEDNKTKRVCFSTSIDGCLIGLSMNCENKIFYVYQPINKYKIYKPNTKEVPDCEITNEVWITQDVRVKCIGKILCYGSYDNPIIYSYGKNNEAKLYKWKWRWIN